MPDARPPRHLGLTLGCVAIVLLSLGADSPVTDIAPMKNLEKATLQQRRELVESLSQAEQFDLKQKQLRFQKLPAAEQKRIRELHQQIHESPDRQQLLFALNRYNEWLRTLPSSKRAAIMSEPPTERLATIKSLFEDQAKRRLFASSPLTPGDYNLIKRWVHGYVRKHEQELLKDFRPELRQRLEDVSPQRKAFMLASALTRDPERMSQIPDEELLVLAKHLSPQAMKSLETAGKHRRELLFNWFRLAGYQLRNMAQRKPPNDLELRVFFNSLDDQRKERLESLPPAETKAALTILYQMERSSSSGFRGPAAVGMQPSLRPNAMKLTPQSAKSAKSAKGLTGSGRALRNPPLKRGPTSTFRATDQPRKKVDSARDDKKN